MTRKVLIFVSPSWPGENSGYEIANASSLAEMKAGYDRVIYFAITDKTEPNPNSVNSEVDFFQIPLRRQSLFWRFAKSVGGTVPAVCVRFNRRNLARQILQKLKHFQSERCEITFVFEDLPIMAMFQSLKGSFPTGKFIFRSHNVMSEAFEAFAEEGNALTRLAWTYENRRIRKFEQWVLNLPIGRYAITHRDQIEMESRYGIRMDGVMGVTIGSSKLGKIKAREHDRESANTIIHLGTLDLRKTHGMQIFIDDVFMPAKLVNKNLRLFLGGKNSERFHDPANNIFGLGFVKSEQEFMNLGQIFVNPQLRGTGVKLKSIIAMAYGKVLLSTPKGVEGIGCDDKRHCLVFDSNRVAKTYLENVSQKKALFESIGGNARSYVQENYSRPG